jgi:hypothetical protein
LFGAMRSASRPTGATSASPLVSDFSLFSSSSHSYLEYDNHGGQ